MKTIEEFCDLHNSCSEGRDWALANCKTMREAWDTARPDWVLWIATRPGVLPDRDLRLFAIWCARQVQHLLTDDRSRAAIDVAERFANGQATQEELGSAWSAAADAAWSAAAAAAAAARSAAWSAAAWSAAQSAAAREAQANYLRTLNPNL